MYVFYIHTSIYMYTRTVPPGYTFVCVCVCLCVYDLSECVYDLSECKCPHSSSRRRWHCSGGAGEEAGGSPVHQAQGGGGEQLSHSGPCSSPHSTTPLESASLLVHLHVHNVQYTCAHHPVLLTLGAHAQRGLQ